MKIGRFLVIAALAALPALAKPNFTGDWKLNVAKSNFGQMPAPSSATYKIAHDEPMLKNSVKQSGEMGDMQFESTVTTDGKESTNEMFGNPLKSTAKWDGDALLVESKGNFGGNDFTLNDKWTLSDDGKTLTVVRTIKSAMGDMDQKLVLEKQ
jgi:hypothetical protein